ncbi:TonB-dependent receptor domain-containing protein [Sphingomonas xanthus]|uniref:TonB-dependent receptor n=1 Tax=Sphingomonas xanthus TaxID=2594473 RepID=A0A516IS59_9SPHN|nr:TonB-dependent receptor [Sphingomonas xanthus]QDP19745.1 TonB-dependent receptor [Sphingomonas xanthus]
MTSTYRNRLLGTTLLVGSALLSTPAFAQEVQEPVVGDTPAEAVDESRAEAPTAAAAQEIVVTGSRIARPNLTSNSPIAVVTGEETVENADVTLDTFLNTLPQVNPAGTTTSNNPGNGGQSSVNLRGLGSNRNLVLIDGRRPMVSATDQSVDLNTIPQGLIERIEIITGGAGAAYGADAIAGVVNMRLKNNFQGVELRGTYSQSVPEWDAMEYQVSGLLGANFDDGRGNIAISAEVSNREDLGKVERPFSVQATSTTGTPPTGRYVGSSGNGLTAAQIQNFFTTQYGITSGAPTSLSRIGFNSDGSLFGVGVFNTPEDVVNYKYDPLGTDPAAANQNFFPDFYSYNFDQTNLLVLPLKRKSAFMRGHYEIDRHAELFVQGGYTEYQSKTALAATPVGTTIENPCGSNPLRAKSTLVECGRTITGLIAPITNPFIQASDLALLLAQRTGDDPALTGTGNQEGVRISKRFLDTGLRETAFDNKVLQGLIGLRGDIVDGWRYEAYYSWGRTTINNAASGNVNVQKVLDLLASPTGGTDLCAGGFNPIGIQPLSADCVEFINETGFTKTEFTQNIAQAYVSGDLAELPGGTMSMVLGVENRRFRYTFDPGVLFGPIAGFNTSTPDNGTNNFLDFFGELLIPIAKDAPWARSAELTLQARRSTVNANDIANGVDPKSNSSWAYGATLSWEPMQELRLRGSYQHSVRAANFGELFSGGGSFPQYFDPCSVTSNFRAEGGAAATALCSATGLGASGANTYVQTPGSQAFIGVNGNPNLKPEIGDTFTLGAVFQKWGITGSIDYYNIRVKDTIFSPDPNMIIAACYGYHGVNPDLNFANQYCSDGGASNFFRTPDISFIAIPDALGGDSSYFQAVNQGKIKTSGIDVQLGYSHPMDFIGAGSRLTANLLVNYLIDYKVEELPGVTIDYAGTASYFGAGLGTSFPEWKANLNLALNVKPFTFSTRIRYIDGMDNRASRQFPGEDLFTGPDSVFYFDFAAEADFKPLTLRIGMNNAFDKKPEEYAPNVQSGTDPSLYDVIGRRAYVSATLRF